MEADRRWRPRKAVVPTPRPRARLLIALSAKVGTSSWPPDCQGSGSEESPQQNKQVGTAWAMPWDALGCLGRQVPIVFAGSECEKDEDQVSWPWDFLAVLEPSVLLLCKFPT